jgi:hypothetical protein
VVPMPTFPPAFRLLACSGRMAYSSIIENQLIGTQHAMVFGAMAAVCLTTWLVSRRRFPFLTITFSCLLLVHPFFWDSGLHGDCGMSLAGGSVLWTVLGAVILAAQLVLWVWAPRPKALGRGFPVDVQTGGSS